MARYLVVPGLQAGIVFHFAMIAGILCIRCLFLPYGFAMQKESGYHLCTGRIVHVSNKSVMKLITVMKKKPRTIFLIDNCDVPPKGANHNRFQQIYQMLTSTFFEFDYSSILKTSLPNLAPRQICCSETRLHIRYFY